MHVQDGLYGRLCAGACVCKSYILPLIVLQQLFSLSKQCRVKLLSYTQDNILYLLLFY